MGGNTGSDFDNKVPYLMDSYNNYVTKDGTPVGEDEASSNKTYRGYALFKVVTLDDGSVELQGFESTATTALYVDAAKGATVSAKSSKITFNVSNNDANDTTNRDSIVVTDKTEFIVRTTNASGAYVYTAYTGTEELPAMAADSVRLMYNYNKDTTVADFVYISDFTPAAAAAKLMFVYQGSYE